MNRFLLIPLAVMVLIVGPFLIWGDMLVSLTSADRAGGRFGDVGAHAGLVGIGLLVADIALPIPTTSVIAGLGIIYGPLVGAAYALAGSMLAALLGYGIGRSIGRPLAVRWIGGQVESGERLFARWGGWLVAGSRWMPVLPEVVSVVAGVGRMPPATFLLAVFAGSLPHAAAFATFGHLGAEAPLWTLLASALIPLMIWLVLDRTGVTRRVRSVPASRE